MIVEAQLRALEVETESLVTLLEGLGAEAWSRPTRCSPPGGRSALPQPGSRARTPCAGRSSGPFA